jgi:hypothetical protein
LSIPSSSGFGEAGSAITPWKNFNQEEIVKAVQERYGTLSLADNWEREGLGLTYPQGLVYFDLHRFRVLVSGRRFGKCLSVPNTRITLLNGAVKPVDKVAVGDEVVSFDSLTCKFKPDRIVAVQSNGIKSVVMIETDRGGITVTPNHPLYVNGAWIEASDIRPGDLLGYMNGAFGDSDQALQWVPILSIKEAGVVETCDLETEGNHTFVANGIVSHNTHLLAHELARAGQNIINGNIAYVAPTLKQARTLMWRPLKFQTIPRDWIANSNETTMELVLKNGAVIRIYGADNYDSLRGQGFDFVAFDETADSPEAVWTEVVYPALSDRQGDAIFVGTPKGMSSWLYDIYLKETQDPDRWRSFTFSTLEGGNVPPDEVDTARKMMSEYTFNQEFLACHLPDTLVRLYDGSVKRIADIQKGDKLVHKNETGLLVSTNVIDGGPTGHKPTMTVVLETGDQIVASNNHPIKVKEKRVPLQEAFIVNRVFMPRQGGGLFPILAALVAYNLGDGNVSERHPTYTKQDGTVSRYKAYKQAQFYSTELYGMIVLADDIEYIFGYRPSVLCKRIPNHLDCHTVQISHAKVESFVEAGMAIGRKTAQIFHVPNWILQSDSITKREFLAALFGAEGSTPAINKNGKCPRSITLSMNKINNVDGSLFFQQLVELLNEFDVKAIVKERDWIYDNDIPTTTYTLYITGEDNAFRFLDRVGYRYNYAKEKLAWLWCNYINAKAHITKQRLAIVQKVREQGGTWAEAALRAGIIGGAPQALTMAAGKYARPRAPHDFPTFKTWCQERLDGDTLILAIVEKHNGPELPVWNINVDSPDHSYLLADGTDNFNSFINPVGRCFHNFYRNVHVSRDAKDHGGDILIGLDFNVSPFSCAIASMVSGPAGPILEFWDELVMLGASTQTAIEEIQRRYPDRRIVVYPDASGRQRRTSAMTGITDFTLLRNAGFQIVAAAKNPPIKDRINGTNAALRNAKGESHIRINPDCRALIRAFDGLTFGEDGKPDKNSSHGLDHMADAASYLIWYALRPLQGKSLSVRGLRGY